MVDHLAEVIIKKLAFLISLLLVASALTVTANPATADACAGHCYGRALWLVSPPSGFTAAQVTLRTNCMTVSDYANSIATNEMWFARGFSTWVETGITVGAQDTGGFLTRPRGFWADMRPDGSYHEHYEAYGATYSLNSSFTVTIYKSSASSTSLDIWGNGTYRGTSTSNFSGWADGLAAGTETTTLSLHTFGSVSGMQWRDLGQTWHGGWISGSSAAARDVDAGLFMNWRADHSWFQSGRGATC